MGQSGCTLEHRLKEHKRSHTTAELTYNPSAVAEHAMKHKHTIDWESAKVIESHSS